MRRLFFPVLTMACVLVLSCADDDSVGPTPDNRFALRLAVIDTDSNAVSGMRVSAINHLSFPVPAVATFPERIKAFSVFSTSIEFTNPVACSLKVIAYDLAHTAIDTLLNEYRDAGVGLIAWGGQSGIPSGVYKIVMEASYQGDSSPEMFKDSILASLHYLDPSLAVLGYTSEEGLYETPDSLRFPSLWPLPTLRRTDEMGNDMGTFTYRDTVSFILTDTATGAYQTYDRVIRSGKNSLQLIWDPTKTRLGDVWKTAGAETSTVLHELAEPPLPDSFALYQNYPNPFN